MIELLFNNDNRCIGYSKIPHSTTNDYEIRQVSESELNKLIPDGFDAESWKEVRRHYKLNGEDDIIFDEDYEPKK